MGELALLMIHNAMSYVGYANSEELRKAAENNDKINQSSIEAYKKVSTLSEDEIKDLMDNETWITAAEALEMGFATEIAEQDAGEEPIQSVRGIIHDKLTAKLEWPNGIPDLIERMDKLIEIYDNPALQLDVEPKTGEVKTKNELTGSARAAAFFNALAK